jgi:hypothetical protein
MAEIETKGAIRCNLKMVMSKMDLDTATSKQIQEALKAAMNKVDLHNYRKFIDNEVSITVL